MSSKELKEARELKELKKYEEEREILMKKEGSWNDEEGIYGYTDKEMRDIVKEYALKNKNNEHKNEKK